MSRDERLPCWFKLGKAMLCFQEIFAELYLHLRGRTRIGTVLISNCFKCLAQLSDMDRRTLLFFL